jgi:hypothetical protein
MIESSMSGSRENSSLLNAPLALGLSLLLSVFVCKGLFAIGGAIGAYHWHIIPGVFGAVMLVLQGGNNRIPWRLFFLECAGFAVLMGIAVFVSAQVIATDFDGLFMHVENVRGLMVGWNPAQDPDLHELLASGTVLHADLLAWKIEMGGKYFTFGQTLQGMMAKGFGLEASKAVNWLYAYFLFRSAWYAFALWTNEPRRSALYAVLAVLNPVILYQLPSFKHDAFVASLLSVILLCGLVFIRRRDVGSAVLYLLAALSLVGMKRSGLGYAMLMTGFFFLFFCIQQHRFIFRKWRQLLSVFVVTAVAAVGLWLSGVWDIRPDIMLPVQQTLSERGSLVPLISPATVFDTYPEYRTMDGLQQFVATSFCETNVFPSHPNWKIPGSVTLRELQNLYQGWTGYWIGGMGPLYGLVLLGSLLASILLLVETPARWRWIAILLVPVLFSVSFLPSLSVRWVPHIWLLALLWVFVMEPVSDGGKRFANKLFTLRSAGDVGRVVAKLATIVLLANSLLIVSLTIAGHAKIRKVLDTQFAILEQLPSPLQVSFDWFPSNRFWFEDRGIAFEIRKPSSPRSRVPYSNLYRTNTRVYLEGNLLEAPVIYPGTGQELPLELALRRLERELPSDAYSWHWIRPILCKDGDGSKDRKL